MHGSTIIIATTIIIQVWFARLKRVVRALRSAAEKRIKETKLAELKKAKHQAKRSQVINAAGKAAKGLFSRKLSSSSGLASPNPSDGSDGGGEGDVEAKDEKEMGEGDEQEDNYEDEDEGGEASSAIAALSGSGAVVDDLIERAFLSCVHSRVPSTFPNMNPLTLDYRAGTAAAFSALGLGPSGGSGDDNDDDGGSSRSGNTSGNSGEQQAQKKSSAVSPRVYRDSALERDVGFALEAVLDGDETAVDAATFERAVWVHCRRKV